MVKIRDWRPVWRVQVASSRLVVLDGALPVSGYRLPVCCLNLLYFLNRLLPVSVSSVTWELENKVDEPPKQRDRSAVTNIISVLKK